MRPIKVSFCGKQIVNLIRRVLTALFITAFLSGVSQAQTFHDQDRAAYAGAYFSMSFGENKARADKQMRYGFSAGFRQRGFAALDSNYNRRFGWQYSDLNLIQSRDVQARVIDLNFSGRGFEHMSVSGLAFAKKDELGQVSYLSDRFNADGEDGGGSKVLLWTGVAVGALAVGLLAVCLTQACGDN